MPYINKKRGSIDNCNICTKKRKLSRDHVPPKSCFNTGSFECNTMFPEVVDYTQKSQNGIKFRTICEQCNNELLGQYDKALKTFFDFICQIVTSTIKLPYRVTYSGEINKITRSVIGHMLAMRPDFIESPIENSLRQYFLNPGNKRPTDWNLHFAVYPYNSIQILRDSFCAEVIGKTTFPPDIISILKFFPMSFILSESTKFGNYQNLTNLCTDNINEVIQIPINLYNCYDDAGHLYSKDWPLRGKNSLALLNDETIRFSKKSSK